MTGDPLTRRGQGSVGRIDAPGAVLVVAKAPVPGQVKTRLATSMGEEEAARLAAAALLDTIDACETAVGTSRCCLALAGDLTVAAEAEVLATRLSRWHVIDQQGDDLGSRLAHAHRDAAAWRERGDSPGPVVQVGMDTPQLTVSDLAALLHAVRDHDAVLGPAEDGGWWGLALAAPHWSAELSAVPTSTPETGVDTARALRRAGARLGMVHSLRDVDTAVDGEVVAAEAPWTRFAATWRAVRSGTGADW